LLSDRELVLQLQSGNLDALGKLYDRYHHVVYRTALAIIGDESAAADLLQDVFLRVHRFSLRIDPNRPLEPWLYRVTTNLTYTWIKRRKRWLLRPIEEMAEWFTGNKKNSPSYQLEKDEEWFNIYQAVATLSLRHRVVIVLHYFNDLSLDEISEVLDIPVGTVKSRLHYGRRALKMYLKNKENTNLGEVQYEFT
jgi:RNA polymerase sigma-70 factor (ECF subfamily)